ncbi:importin alpha [Anaeramoeba flamelloides]|uniref:Importin subunit alpha n=1 Tax=Anaeramoeba flamelloides TaxID=1746091 RepID=A0ABQ8YXP6_9EUKA|nr:importin alpha [Anaeramoeba flamelloides]
MSNFQRKLRKRQERFKQKKSHTSSINKRINYNIQISKSKRENGLMKRRNIIVESLNDENLESNIQRETISFKQELNVFVKYINSNNQKNVLEGIHGIRLMLSVQDNPPVKQVLQTGVIPKILTYFATNTDYDQQCIWALGNLAGDSAIFRDQILDYDEIIEKISNIYSIKNISLQMARNGVWVLVKKAIPTFTRLIMNRDVGLISDASWGLSFVVSTKKKAIDAIIDSGSIPRLVFLLGREDKEILIPVLRTLASVVSGNFTQTNEVLQYGILSYFQKLLSHKHSEIRRLSCWTLSNITAGDPQQIESVYKSGIIPHLIELFEKDIEKIQKEICWVLSNIVECGEEAHIHLLVEKGVIKVFCKFLNTPDLRIVRICLESLEKILELGKQNFNNEMNMSNLYITQVEEMRGFEKMSKLLEEKTQNITKTTKRILDNFYLNSNNVDFEDY